MSKAVIDQDVERIETTIGELVETITQIALESGKNEQESYELASLAMESILRKNILSVQKPVIQ